jgi:arylsulfatase A-like enzyme
VTGLYATRFGHENNSMVRRRLPADQVTMGQRLKTLGYATTIVGKWHLGQRPPDAMPMKRGFDDYFGVLGNPGSYFHPNGFIDSKVSPRVQEIKGNEFYTTDAFAARASQWMEQHKDQPWFLYLPFNAVHVPHEATEKYLKRFAHITDPRKRVFNAMLSGMDDGVGTVMQKLRDLGLEERTLVFFISDNGAPTRRQGNGPLRGGKYTTWEGGFRLPFMLQWKGTLPAGKIYDLPVIQLDVLPTCLAVAGGTVDPNWKLDGVNLLPYLKGQNKEQPHETLYWRIDGMWAIRHGDLKLVHAEPGSTPPQLYDLAADIGEKKDLATTQANKVKDLKALWDRWNAQQAKASAPANQAEENKQEQLDEDQFEG